MKYKINKLPNGRCELVFRPLGVNSRQVRKRFDTKTEAERFAVMVKAKVLAGHEWNPSQQKLETRRLSELVDEWYQVRGFSLKTGAARREYMLYVCRVADDPLARDLNNSLWTDIRTLRAKGGVSVSTLNHDLVHFKGMFTDLIAAGKWSGTNPLAAIKKQKTQQQEMAYLSHEQIAELLEKLLLCKERDAYLVAKLCLATGARWVEAETVTANHIKNGMVYYAQTKSGKGRTVPIGDDLEKELKAGRTGGFHRLFQPCYGAFRKRLQQCSFKLPEQQAAHVLRHTFASHFIQAGGSILTLQKILGHASVETTMIYAHLAPDHLAPALSLNPLALMKKSEGKFQV